MLKERSVDLSSVKKDSEMKDTLNEITIYREITVE